MSDFFSLFDDGVKRPSDLVAGDRSTLDSISEEEGERESILAKIRTFTTASALVDYSDFSNFVFFNSALDYFNITGEKILNEYPHGGSAADVQSFSDDLDDYQRHVLDIWPKHTGHLRFDPSVSSSYIIVNDVGNQSNTTRNGLLSPGTGSFSVEMWVVPPPTLTGSDDVMVLVQKGQDPGYSIFASGSRICASVSSGSTSIVSVPFISGQVTYVSFVVDRNVDLAILYTGSISRFPELVDFSNIEFTGDITNASSPLTMGSGSMSGKVIMPLSGSIDDVRVWNDALSISKMSSSFNTRIYAQNSLVGLWNFNESGRSLSGDAENSIVVDHAGSNLDGRIFNYFSSMRGSGSLLPYDKQDPVLTLSDSDVAALIADKQGSGTLYDRDNDNIITNLMPSKFFEMEDDVGTDVLRKFLYILARQFDILKVKIDQFTKVTRTNYGDFDQTPDALLEDIGRFFGWEFTGNFLSAAAPQYVVGKGILSNVEANRELDTKLYEIKNAFWRRVLNNLAHIYKTKGTRESVESLLRVYGVDNRFVRLKEFSTKKVVGLTSSRIPAEKSVTALTFGTASFDASLEPFGEIITLGGGSGPNAFVSASITSSFSSVEFDVAFPTTGTYGMSPTATYGTTVSFIKGLDAGSFVYLKDSVTGDTGMIAFAYGGDTAAVTGTFFDGSWIHVASRMSTASIEVVVSKFDEYGTLVNLSASANSSAPYPANFVGYDVNVGRLLLFPTLACEAWVQEVRVWNSQLSDAEIEDHTRNFQSYGRDDISSLSDLVLHLRLREHKTASLGGAYSVDDVSGNGHSGRGTGFIAGKTPSKKFLREYSYIAPPDAGWTNEKIRTFDATSLTETTSYDDHKVVALEFNLVDALNEDISQILSQLDAFDDLLDTPASRYRDQYQKLDLARRAYFSRLNGKLHFSRFADMLEFFDRSFVDVIRKIIPARASFVGDELVVESHMLERPKYQWPYRRRDVEFEPEGRIVVVVRDGSSPSIAKDPVKKMHEELGRGFRFANVPGGDAKNVDFCEQRLNSVMTIEQSTSDKTDSSGVVVGRVVRRTIPKSIIG